MSKLKTKSSVKKRFKLTASGKVKCGVPFKRHNLSHHAQKMKNKSRGTFVLSEADAKIVKKHMA
jgi:large subunit ribosomal protein L35